jgi:hypothetical protein
MMRTTTLRRIYEVYHFKIRKEALQGKLGAAKIAAMYKERMNRAETSEEVSTSFVDNAITIHERLLSQPRARDVLTQAEEEAKVGRNPFEHISKLLAVVQKTSSPEIATWVIETVWDICKAQNFPEPPSTRAFLGSVPGSGGKGLVDLQAFKDSMRRHLIGEALVQHKWQDDVKTTLQQVFEGVQSYRKKCGYPNNLVKDQTWRAGWPESAEAYFRLVEGLVFSDTYDAVLKIGIKSRKTPAETLQLEGVAEIMADIAETEEDEGKQHGKQDGDAEDSGQEHGGKMDEDCDEVEIIDSGADGALTAVTLGKLEAFARVEVATKMELNAKSDLMKDMAAQALRLIQTHITLIVEDGLTDDELAKERNEGYGG